MAKNKAFPTFWVIVLVFAALWFLSDLGVVSINVPWLSLIVLIVAIGAIINHYHN